MAAKALDKKRLHREIESATRMNTPVVHRDGFNRCSKSALALVQTARKRFSERGEVKNRLALHTPDSRTGRRRRSA